MTEPTETWISTERITAEDWHDLASKMTMSAGWCETTSVFVYTESLHGCQLEQHKASKALESVTRCVDAEFTSLLEGRIFDSRVEARWRRVTDGRWMAWIVRELEDAAAVTNDSNWTKKARRLIRPYYLLGVYASDANDFREGRYAKRFAYPTPNGRPQDRAYIEVAEYLRVEPQWSDVSRISDCLLQPLLNDCLLQPLLFAHRFVSVGVGTGPREG